MGVGESTQTPEGVNNSFIFSDYRPVLPYVIEQGSTSRKGEIDTRTGEYEMHATHFARVCLVGGGNVWGLLDKPAFDDLPSNMRIARYRMSVPGGGLPVVSVNMEGDQSLMKPWFAHSPVAVPEVIGSAAMVLNELSIADYRNWGEVEFLRWKFLQPHKARSALDLFGIDYEYAEVEQRRVERQYDASVVQNGPGGIFTFQVNELYRRFGIPTDS